MLHKENGIIFAIARAYETHESPRQCTCIITLLVKNPKLPGLWMEQKWKLEEWSADAVSFLRIGDQVNAEGESDKLPNDKPVFRAVSFRRWEHREPTS
jgi:hypothetical protein